MGHAVRLFKGYFENYAKLEAEVLVDSVDWVKEVEVR